MVRRRRVRWDIERLEARRLLANLTATRLQVIDGEGESIAPPMVGEYLRFRAEWISSDLIPSQLYLVRISLDGITQEAAFRGVSGQNVTQSVVLEGWFAGAGARTATLSVDAGNGVFETLESDNQTTLTFTSRQPTSLPSRFLTPIGGEQGRDWTIAAYPDHEPGPDARDYKGGLFSSQAALDTRYLVANAAAMDRGVPVYAAAGGTIVSIEGRFPDRPLRSDAAVAAGENRVVIAHGNGWLTVYSHLMGNSIAVREGDSVQAGQLIALVGSSGGVGDAQLGFQVYHSDGSNLGDSNASLVPVDTWMAPGAYWNNPSPYQGETAPRLMDGGISDSPFLEADFAERPADAASVTTRAPRTLWHWMRFSHLRLGDRVDFQWIRPDGSVEGAYSSTLIAGPDEVVWPRFTRMLDAGAWAAFPGTWKAQAKINGSLVATSSVVVTTEPGAPRLRLSEGSLFDRPVVINGRTTPYLLPTTSLVVGNK